jgi:hypothetical protein
MYSSSSSSFLGKEVFMSRTVQILKLKFIVPVAVLIVAGAAVDIWSHTGNEPAKISNQAAVHQKTTHVSYYGVDGQNALTLLKRHAQVQTKHYSFGDQVIAINGTAGNGPKYWTFYVNGQESSVGAGSYVTKNSDKLEWKLQ